MYGRVRDELRATLDEIQSAGLYKRERLLDSPQAAHVEMPLTTQLVMLLTFMLSSKGVAGVPRATLVIIAGTCASFGLPGEAGIAMLLAVDELMDMARTTINVIGNALASVVIARWEGVFGVPDETPAAPGTAAGTAAGTGDTGAAEGHA